MSLINKKSSKRRKITAATVLFTPVIFHPLALAADTQEDKTPDELKQLEKITVETNREELSSNSKIVKDIKQLEKQQVNDIRDLIRYDPGISVLEQNRGGSGGFAIRGVDRNRVAVSVDGLPQIQSFLATRSQLASGTDGSGARNEIELENLSQVKLHKGSNSTQVGSGALGGSVNFTTKNVHDILDEGEKFALTSKTAYTSKNSQIMQSVGTAFDTGKLRGLFQYTYRDGKETKVHKDILKKKYTIQRLGAFVNKYKLDTNTPNELSGDKFYKCETCTEPFYKSYLTRFYDLESAIKHYQKQHTDPNRKFTPEELEQLKQMVHPTETLSAKDITGPNREAPDPLRTSSHSYLGRFEYQITPNQTIGAILEDTKQHYFTREMSTIAYTELPPTPPNFPKPQLPPEPKRPDYNDFCKGSVCDDAGFDLAAKQYLKDIQDYRKRVQQLSMNKEFQIWKDYEQKRKDYTNSYLGLYSVPNPSSSGTYLDDIMLGPYAPGVYTRTTFSREVHRKQRQSLNYVLNLRNKWVDQIELNLDFQKIRLNSDYRQLSCRRYPAADPNCRASATKPGSSEFLSKVNYQEKYKHLGFKYDKSFTFSNITYRLNAIAGGAHYDAELDRQAYSIRFGGLQTEQRKGKNQLPETHIKNNLGRISESRLKHADHCLSNKLNKLNHPVCDFRIKGQNRYYGLNNQIAFGKLLDIGFGFRKDRDFIVGNKKFLAARTYKNTSYQFNSLLKPIEGIGVSYSYSTGFRNPSLQELSGWAVSDDIPTNQLKPETSATHEVGLTFNGNWGYIEANKFISKYKNLISFATPQCKNGKCPGGNWNYNFSNATIEGYSIQGLFDLHAILSAVPSGFSSNIAYERTKPKSASRVSEDLVDGTLYPFDAIQPPRFVVSLNYDSPAEKWGSSLILTHSRAKDVSELLTTSYIKRRDGSNRQEYATNLETKPWTTLDWLGYYEIRKNIRLNVGVYNLLNKQYSTWESVRRGSSHSIHPEKQLSIARYAAPGRNYFVSLNMKF